MASWIPVSPESDFSLDNLPFGIFSSSLKNKPHPRPGVAIGDYIIDLLELSSLRQFQDATGLGPGAVPVFQCRTLNIFASLGREKHSTVRAALKRILAKETTGPDAFLRDFPELQSTIVVHKDNVVMHLPMKIGDYTDFYAGVHHATNVGSLFRDPKNPLPANYGTLPIAYHGRASSVVVSGSTVRRPVGQILVPQPDGGAPTVEVRPSLKLDFELELGCFISQPNNIGEPISVTDAKDHIFGYVLLNDWSARDIQSYEYVPLGPFSGKNFTTSISPWVVLAEALEPFQKPISIQPKQTFAYLEGAPRTMFDLNLEVDLQLPGNELHNVTTVSSNNLMWSFPQMVAQHTLSGCPLNTGDLFGTGTISGASSDKEYGSLLELSKNGKEALQLGNKGSRSFLVDGDTVTFRGYATHPVSGGRVGFGECTGTILPAHSRGQ